MKKSVYVEKISQELNMTKKDVQLVTDAFIKELTNAIVNQDSVIITNFGTFRKKSTKPYSCFSPIDGSSLEVKKQIKVFFSCSKELKERLTNESDD